MAVKKIITTPPCAKGDVSATSYVEYDIPVSSAAMHREESGSIWILVMILLLLIGAALTIYFLLIDKHTRIYKIAPVPSAPSSSSAPMSPMDAPATVSRFKRLRNQWLVLEADASFKLMAKTLMEMNDSALNMSGNSAILNAFTRLDQFLKASAPLLPPNLRVTLIYTDGIVFYDSVLPINRIYFMDDSLPKPVNLYTLGSPLKDYNTLPENMNSLMIHHPHEPAYFLGGCLKDPIYRQLGEEGFGFFERNSSSLNTPYTYLSRFLLFDTDPSTSFMNGCTLRISMPVSG